MPGSISEQIVALLVARGPMTLSKISAALGKNPGTIRMKLLTMEASGRLTVTVGPDGWRSYSPGPQQGGQHHTR